MMSITSRLFSCNVILRAVVAQRRVHKLYLRAPLIPRVIIDERVIGRPEAYFLKPCPLLYPEPKRQPV